MRSASTTSAPASRRSAAGVGPVTTAIAVARAARAPTMSPGWSPTYAQAPCASRASPFARPEPLALDRVDEGAQADGGEHGVDVPGVLRADHQDALAVAAQQPQRVPRPRQLAGHRDAASQVARPVHLQGIGVRHPGHEVGEHHLQRQADRRRQRDPVRGHAVVVRDVGEAVHDGGLGVDERHVEVETEGRGSHAGDGTCGTPTARWAGTRPARNVRRMSSTDPVGPGARPPRRRRAPTPVARSLADDLRGRDDDELAALLRARPDLVNPVPADLSALATRAATTTSVVRALDRLDLATLQVLEAIAALPEPARVADLAAGLPGLTGSG